MGNKSWIQQYIEEELASRVLEIRDPIADCKAVDGKIRFNRPKTEIVEELKKTRQEFRTLEAMISLSPRLCPANTGGNSCVPQEFIEKNLDHLYAVLLFQHDTYSTLSRVGDYEQNLDIAIFASHHILNTLLTMAYLSSKDKRYVRKCDPHPWLTHEEERSNYYLQRGITNYKLNFSIQGNPAFDNLIYTVVYNLMKNATSWVTTIASPSKEGGPDNPGVVDVRFYEGKDYRYVVKDNGPGIKPDKMPTIFSGLELPRHGLGLWTSRRIAELKGGDIVVESSTGQDSFRYETKNNTLTKISPQPKGTTFSFICPKY
jgi:signal transduction histidine kinase